MLPAQGVRHRNHHAPTQPKLCPLRPETPRMNDDFGRPVIREPRAQKRLRFLLYALAAIYFAACAVVLFARWFVTTQIESHKTEIEQIIYDAAGVRVEAQALKGGFHRLHPTFVLKNVALSRPDGPVSLVLPKVEAELSWSSLWHLEPRFRTLVVSSPELTVRRLAAGRYDIGGFVIEASADEKPKKPLSAEQPFTRWLLAQDRLVLKNGRFTYIDETVAKPQPVEVKDAQGVFDQRLLDWRAAVRVTLVELSGKERTIEAKARIEKSLFSESDNPLTWKGEAYLHADRINAGRLLRRVGLDPRFDSGGSAVRLWLSFDAGRIDSLTTDLAVHNARLQLDEELKPMKLSSLSGRFTYAEDKAGQIDFRAHGLAFSGPSIGRFGPTSLSASCREDASGRVLGCRFGVDELPIGVLANLTASLPLPKSVRDFLATRSVSGKLRQLEAAVQGDFNAPENWTVNGGFTGLTLPVGRDGFPGMKNISGIVRSMRPGEFHVQLNTHAASLTFPGVFREPQLHFDSLAGDVRIDAAAPLKLTFMNVSAKNADAAVSGSGTWTATGGAGTIDIAGELLSAQATSVIKYLPNSIGQSALDYVGASIMGGRAVRGRYVVRGPLAHFPWDGRRKGEGLFRIEGDVENGVMDFMPSGKRLANGRLEREAHWPKLEKISAHLLFEGNRMLITGSHAESMGLRASQISVEIPSFAEHPPRLLIKGTIDGDLGDALGYLHASTMLRGFVGTAFEVAKGSGPQSTQLDLVIPLSGQDEDAADLRYRVTTRFSEDSFQYLPTLPTAAKLSGTLQIDEKGIRTTEPFAGSLDKGPIRASAATVDDVLDLRISAAVSPDDLTRLFDSPAMRGAAARLSGTASADLTLRVPHAKPDDWTLQGSTDLRGIRSTLPPPFEKAAETPWPTSFAWQPVHAKAAGARQLSVSINDLAQTRLVLADQADSHALLQGGIGIGAAAPAPVSGIAVAVNAPVLPLSDWQQVFADASAQTDKPPKKPAGDEPEQSIEDIIAAAQQTTAAPERSDLDVENLIHSIADSALTARLETLQLETGRLSLAGEAFTNVSAALRRHDDNWHLRIRADQASGQIEVNNAGSRSAAAAEPLSLSVKLDRLHLPASLTSGVERQLGKPASTLPNLNIVIDDLRLGERRIGKVELDAVNDLTPEGLRRWRIDHAAVRGEGGTLIGTGRWTDGQNDSDADRPYGPGETIIKLKADIQSGEKVLKNLRMENVLRDTPADIDINLRWRGMPTGFNWETLSGDIAGRAGAGAILPVEPGAGRLLSLLSMQHLMRRLMLDFHDVAGKGFSFDNITAAATIRNGMMHSEKSTLIGSAATILVGGDIDLVNEILDLRALVLPSINAEGASIALAVLNPAIGIGTLLAQWVLKDQVSQMLSSEYEIRGSFSSPEVQKAPAAKPNALSLFP